MYLRIIQQMHCHDHCSNVAWKFSDIPRYISNKTWLHLIPTEPEQNTKRNVTAYLISPDVADIRLMPRKQKRLFRIIWNSLSV